MLVEEIQSNLPKKDLRALLQVMISVESLDIPVLYAVITDYISKLLLERSLHEI